MHLLPFISMISLALAVPHTKRQSCVGQDWLVRGFSSFTADPGPTGVSYISFTFGDSNTETNTDNSSLCSRSLAPGSGQSPADPDNFYPCEDPEMQYKFDGKKLTLKHTFDCAGYVQKTLRKDARSRETRVDRMQQNDGNRLRQYRFGPSMHPLRQHVLRNGLCVSCLSGRRTGLELGSVKVEAR